MPRATTAAWLTRPPRDVRIPSAAIMPWRSSGEVSGRTRITDSPAFVVRLGVVGGEVHLPHRSAGRCVEPLGERAVLRARVELRVQELVELCRLHSQHGLALVDHPLLLHLDRHAERGRGGALPDPGLEDEEATLLDRELDVAHVAVVRLERVHDVEELHVALGEVVRHRVERLGGADAGDDVLALSVREEVAVRDGSHPSPGRA